MYKSNYVLYLCLYIGGMKQYSNILRWILSFSSQGCSSDSRCDSQQQRVTGSYCRSMHYFDKMNVYYAHASIVEYILSVYNLFNSIFNMFALFLCFTQSPTMMCFVQLPSNYNFEIPKTLWRVQTSNAKIGKFH